MDQKAFLGIQNFNNQKESIQQFIHIKFHLCKHVHVHQKFLVHHVERVVQMMVLMLAVVHQNLYVLHVQQQKQLNKCMNQHLILLYKMQKFKKIWQKILNQKNNYFKWHNNMQEMLKGKKKKQKKQQFYYKIMQVKPKFLEIK